MCDCGGNCTSHGSGGGLASIKLLKYQISRQGFAVSYALGGTPSFACTTGLEETFGHPEIVVAGLDFEQSTALLTHLAGQIRKGVSFAEGAICPGNPGYPVVAFVTLPENVTQSYLRETAAYYGDRPFRALQVLWPDDTGRFPEDEACNVDVRRLQTMRAQAR